MTAGPLVMGVDLGGTKVRAALGDASGALLAIDEAPTADAGAGLDRQLAALLGRLAAAAGVDPAAVRATAVGGAGVASADGFTLAPNLAHLDGTDVRGALEEALGHAVVLENDVNVAALGELHAGDAGDDFAFVSLGTGIGMGLVLGGRLIRGARGAAGEIGYLPLGADPLDPDNHRRGALEEMVAGETIAQRYEDLTGTAASTRQVFSRAARGDDCAAAVVDGYARWVAAALGAVIAVVDPGRIVLGGGIGLRPELLPRVQTWLARIGHSQVPVVTSALGDRAPLAGAVHLALEATHPQGVPA
ncbi:ROK family protein [Demequina sp. NBRC 110057]|uniref:ROK family protein n=1 Tax=Demequina sp. NBRC 110057 TaxID=1570346 RepID=UPI0009FBC149|nr:ROK family protein [Demequina sp. NBRC 110057]